MPKPLSLDDHIFALESFDQDEQAFKDKIHQKLQERCEVDPLTGCWVYTGCWEQSGIAKIRVGTRIYCVPRVAAWLYWPHFHLWDVPLVGRTCDTAACFCPDHLIVLADQAAALALQLQTGRLGAHHRHLNRSKVTLLRQSAEGLAGPEVAALVAAFAAQEGISLRAVWSVLRKETWRDGAV